MTLESIYETRGNGSLLHRPSTSPAFNDNDEDNNGVYSSRESTPLIEDVSDRVTVASGHLMPSQHLVGDPLEMQLFDTTGWRLSEPGDAEHAYVPSIAAPYTYVHPKDEHGIAFNLSENRNQLPHASPNTDSDFAKDRLEAWANNGFGGRFKPWKEKIASGLAVLKHYTFSSHNQRMSVLVGACLGAGAKDDGEVREGPVFSYIKGAPERIIKLCNPHSIPADFSQRLQSYTSQGLRVLAVAGRHVPGTWSEAKTLTRDVIEKDLHLLGLAVFENRVKPRTASTIAKLSNAEIRTVMITGDNILTACSVGKSCGMVDPRSIVLQAFTVERTDVKWRRCFDSEFVHRDLALETDRLGQHSVAEFENVMHLGHLKPSIDISPEKQTPSDFCIPMLDNEDSSSANGLDSEVPVYELVLERADHGNKAVFPAGVEADGLKYVRFTKLAGKLPASRWRKRNHPQDEQVSIAISGAELATLRQHCFQDYQRLIVTCTIFARMSPDQKTQLIEDLIDLGYCVGMCGDGANDCGALKAAHVGVSLSEAEASVAAPFTSTVADIDCVETLIREGRCALVTSFSCFKFMALYSFIEFTSVMIVYWIDSNLGDFQYLYVDLFVILSLAVTMGRTGPYVALAKKRPPGSLVTPVIITSLLLQIGIHMIFQAGALLYLKQQTWFVPLQPSTSGDNIECFENTVIFLVSNFQYVWVSLAFSIAKPFRAPLYTNISYIIIVCALLGFNTFLTLHPSGWFANVLELMYLPSMSFRLWLLAIAVGNFLISYLLEQLIVTTSTFQGIIRAIRRKRQYKNKYKDLAKDIITSNWIRSRVAERVNTS